MRSISIFLIFTALVIQLGHDIIPHHHEDSHSDLAGHHHAHPFVPFNSNENQDENGFKFSDVLSFLSHDYDEFTYVNASSNDSCKRIFVLDLLLPESYSFCNDFLLIKQNAPPNIPDYRQVFQIVTAALRGPPVFLA